MAAAALGLIFTVALTFFGLLLVTFLIGRVVPIDPVLAAVGDRAPAEVYDRVREELGLHLPLWQQFYLYAMKAVQGDFGRSVLTSNPVVVDIARGKASIGRRRSQDEYSKGKSDKV